MLDIEDLLSVPGFDKLNPGNQQKVRAFFFRQFVAPRAYYRRAAPDEKNQIARETIFGPEEPRAKPTLPERFLARGHEALSLGFRPAEELPAPETTGEVLAEQIGGFAGAAAPFFLFAQAGFPAGAALAAKMAGPASRFVAPTLARTVGEEALKFGLTGTAEEAVKGALQQRPTAETARVMAERFPGEAAFGGAFGALTPRVPSAILEPPSPTFFKEARKSFAEEEAAQPKPPPGTPPSQPTPPPAGGLPPSLSIPAIARSASGKDIRIDFENPVEKAAYLYQQTGKPDLAPFIVENVQGTPEQFIKSIQAKVDRAAATADRIGLSFGYVKAGEAPVGKPVSISALNRAAAAVPTQGRASQQPPVFESLMTKEGVKNKRRAEAALRMEDAESKKAQIIADAQMILADANASEFSKQAAREALKEAGVSVKPPMGKVAAAVRAKAERGEPVTIEDTEAINAEARQPLGTPPVFQPTQPKPVQRRLGEEEIAPSTYIRRFYVDRTMPDGTVKRNAGPGIKIPASLKEEFGAWNRWAKKDGAPIEDIAEEMVNNGILKVESGEGPIDALMRYRAEAPARRGSAQMSSAKRQETESLYGIATTTGDASILEAIIKDTKLPEDIRLAAEKNLAEIRAFEKDAVEFGEPIDFANAPKFEFPERPVETRVAGVEPKSLESPRFEPTQAGTQGVLAETPQRTVPTGGLKAKGKQAEGLTELEKANLPETQVDMFGPKPQGGDRFTPTKTPALDAELQKFPRGGAPLEDTFLTNIRSEDIRMLPTNVQKAVLFDSPVRVNFAEPGKLAQVKFQLERWASVHDVPISMPLEFIYRGSEAGEHLLSQMNNHASKTNAFHHYFLDSLSDALKVVPESSERQVVGKLLDWNGARWVAEQMGIVNPTARPMPQPSMAQVASITRVFNSLSPEQRVLYSSLRQWLDEAGRTVGFEPGVSFTDYLSRFRESIEIGRTIQIKIGEGEVSKTLTEMMPPKLKAYFENPRTTDQPADLPLEETLKIYSAALARRIATSGGLDPRAPDVPVEGFLNRINPALANIPQPLQPFTKVLLEYYLGLGKGASEKSVGTELIRLVQFNRNMGLNMLSPVVNHTQKMNTMAEVGPTAFVQGWRDMYDPQRLAIAKAAGADIDIGPILQELGQVKAEGLLGKVLEKSQEITKVTGYLFRQSERSNQLHAFLSGLRRAEQVFGEITPEAISYARDIQAGTQFGLPSSKVLTWEQNGIMGAWGQFKRFQVNQLLYPARILSRDIADMRQGNYSSATRTLGYLTVVTALVGADGIFPGLDDQARKHIFEKWPGGLAGLMGIYLADRVGLGAEDSRDIMRSVLFFMPGPMANNLIDAWSGARGVDFWTGREMGAAERSSKLTRSIPLSGIVIDRLRRAWVESQGPLQPNTMAEGFGVYPPTGARGETRRPEDIAMMAVGLPSARIHEELERKRGRGDVRLEAMRTLREASDKYISGEIASSRNEYNRAVELKSDATRLIVDFNKEHPGANLRLQGRNLREARERRRFTPTERQKRAFPRSLRGVEEMREPPRFQPGLIQ